MRRQGCPAITSEMRGLDDDHTHVEFKLAVRSVGRFGSRRSPAPASPRPALRVPVYALLRLEFQRGCPLLTLALRTDLSINGLLKSTSQQKQGEGLDYENILHYSREVRPLRDSPSPHPLTHLSPNQCEPRLWCCVDGGNAMASARRVKKSQLDESDHF